MRGVGTILLLLGIGSIVLHFMEREFQVLAWIDNWDENAAWGIRGGFVLLGLILLAAGKKKGRD